MSDQQAIERLRREPVSPGVSRWSAFTARRPTARELVEPPSGDALVLAARAAPTDAELRLALDRQRAAAAVKRSSDAEASAAESKRQRTEMLELSRRRELVVAADVATRDAAKLARDAAAERARAAERAAERQRHAAVVRAATEAAAAFGERLADYAAAVPSSSTLEAAVVSSLIEPLVDGYVAERRIDTTAPPARQVVLPAPRGAPPGQEAAPEEQFSVVGPNNNKDDDDDDDAGTVRARAQEIVVTEGRYDGDKTIEDIGWKYIATVIDVDGTKYTITITEYPNPKSTTSTFKPEIELKGRAKSRKKKELLRVVGNYFSKTL